MFIPDLGPLPSSLRRHSRRGQQTAVCGVEDVSQSSWPIFVRVMPAQVSSAESAPPAAPAPWYRYTLSGPWLSELISSKWLSVGTLSSLCAQEEEGA